MKYIRAWLLALVATLALVNAGCYHCALQPTHSIQPGQIIKNGDLRCSKVGPYFGLDDFIGNKEKIVGHKALSFLNEGTRIHASQVDPEKDPDAEKVKDLWAPIDPNDKTVIKEPR